MTETPTADEIEFESNRTHTVSVGDEVYEIPHEIYPHATRYEPAGTGTAGMTRDMTSEKNIGLGSAGVGRAKPSDHEFDEITCVCDICFHTTRESDDESMIDHLKEHLADIEAEPERYAVEVELC